MKSELLLITNNIFLPIFLLNEAQDFDVWTEALSFLQTEQGTNLFFFSHYNILYRFFNIQKYKNIENIL